MDTRLRDNIVTFILNHHRNKLPIKHHDLVVAMGDDSVHFNMNFRAAEELLSSLCGFVISLVPNSKVKKYIIYSDHTAITTLEYSEEQKRDFTLLFLVTSFIFMSGGSVEEPELEEFLGGLNIHFDESHPYFGSDVKEIIQEIFPKQLYLNREKIVSEIASEVKIGYSLGYRSECELTKKELLNASAKILRKPAEKFISQYSQVLEEEGAADPILD